MGEIPNNANDRNKNRLFLYFISGFYVDHTDNVSFIGGKASTHSPLFECPITRRHQWDISKIIAVTDNKHISYQLSKFVFRPIQKKFSALHGTEQESFHSVSYKLRRGEGVKVVLMDEQNFTVGKMP